MFGKLDAVGPALAAAVGAAEQERRRLAPVLAAVEAYAAARKLVVGGDGGVEALLGLPISLASYTLVVFCGDARAHARDRKSVV